MTGVDRAVSHDRPRGRSRSRSRSRSVTRDKPPHRRESPARNDRSRHERTRRRSRSRSPVDTDTYSRRRGHSRSRSRSPRRRSRDRDMPRDRKSSRDREKYERVEKRQRGRSHSLSGSDHSSDESDRHRKKKKKDRKRERSSRSRERKERKREKKEKKEKKKKSAAMTSQWGKHGIISEADLYTKEQEFRTWLVEERKVNPETISKDQTKKEFARFVEDYNTATLPHEKYYNMDKYEARMSALRQGEYLPPADDAYDPMADMRAHQSKHKRQAVDNESYLSKEQLLELRKVQSERIEAGRMKLLGMEIKQNMGVRMDGTMFDG